MYAGMHFDYVVTVCDRQTRRALFTGGGKNYIRFPDPAGFGGDEEIMAGFRTSGTR
jgi:hypothetical protein